MDLIEGVGESSSPPRSFGTYDVRLDVYNRLMESRNEEAVSNPDFREQLDAHFNRLPPSYLLDVNIDRVEDVLLHQKLLALAKEPDKRPAYHVRFLENLSTKADSNDDQQSASDLSTARPCCNADNEGAVPSHYRYTIYGLSQLRNEVDFEPCSKLEDLNLDVRKDSTDMEGRYLMENSSIRQETSNIPIHEVIFSTIDKPKLLSQLSALLSDIGLNIREAHVFSTIDGYSLDVFVVDGWPVEDTDGLDEAMEKAITRSEDSWSGSSHSHSAVEKALAAQVKSGDWEIDRRLLKIGERIASGSCGDLYHGVYLGQDVAVKILRSEHLNESLEDEFAQEVAILREVQHRNVVRFIGACTKSPHLCIVTEYMPGGSLYDYLHKNHNVLKLPQLLKFAIDVCKGMEYLHHNNIIHRDLKTANLLMDNHNVVKVADFGVARFQNQEGVMTAETGTYRWMAPEVINHLPYDQKADVFSFAIVLWELTTAKIPYDNMTPLQAALGVRQLYDVAICAIKISVDLQNGFRLENLQAFTDRVIQISAEALSGLHFITLFGLCNLINGRMIHIKRLFDAFGDLGPKYFFSPEGLRPDLPDNTHPKLVDLMQRCWEAVPGNRPSFSEIAVELEELLQEVQGTSRAPYGK